MALPAKIPVAGGLSSEHVISVKSKSSAAPKTARDALFSGMPKHVRELRKDAHKHERLKKRTEFKNRVLLGQVPTDSLVPAGVV